TFREITAAVFSLAFSPDGRRLAAAGIQAGGPKPFLVKVWDANTGQEAFTIPPQPGAIRAMGFSPARRCLALGRNDGIVKLWDAATGLEIGLVGRHDHVVRGLAFRRDGRHLASASDDGTVKIWDVTPAPAPRRDWRAWLPVLGLGSQAGGSANIPLSAAVQVQ